jgi:UDP-2,4-diacetamido-2,4,6-trideoxy-beta-L-altropyranose hydrolase
MHIVFRTDASLQIGTGHVMRCLTLAHELRERGAQCSFICREHPGNLIDLILQRGFLVRTLLYDRDWMVHENTLSHASWLGSDWQTDADESKIGVGETAIDWLIVDHYALNFRWEHAMRAHCHYIMVIDDLADRMHDCDLLLNQNFGSNLKDYDGLLKVETTALIGPQYALLRPEFSAFRSESLARRQNNPRLHQLLVNMGGVDRDNVTGLVLTALQPCTLPVDFRVTVVMGLHAPWLTQVRAQAKQMPWRTEVLAGVDNMAQLMAESDLAIGAAGATSWERCCLGLPTIQIALAQNQVSIAQALSDAGVALMLRVETIAQTLPRLIDTMNSADKLCTSSVASSAVTQGNGAALVSDHIKEAKEAHENHSLMQ